MKKFFYLLFSVIFCVFSAFSVSGCSKSEVDKISKNLTTYAISAELDAEKMEISGIEKIDYINNTGSDLEFVCLHLYPRAFRQDALIKPYTALNVATCFPNGISYGDIAIISVKVNGEIKSFELTGEDEDILKINFGFSLQKNGRVEIVIEFVLTIPNSTHRFGYYQANVNLGNWYPIVCRFENGGFNTSPYYSTGDPFDSEIANYEVNFSYPVEYLLSSTGEVFEEVSGAKKTATIKAKAVRDFAMSLSSNSKEISSEIDGVKIKFVDYVSDVGSERYLDVSKLAVSYFGDVFGKYPYSSLTIVKTPFVFGGMEYPNIVYISDSIDTDEEFLKVIVHEIAHQWWYSCVGNNEVTEAWLDESLSEYSTALFFGAHSEFGISYDDFVNDALSSYLLYVDVIETIRGDVNTKMNLAVNEYQNDYEYSYMVYVKGVIMFDSLKSAVGEQKMLAGFKKYYQDNKFKIATKNEFYSAFKSACHQDLENFFEGYLNGTTIISKIN